MWTQWRGFHNLINSSLGGFHTAPHLSGSYQTPLQGRCSVPDLRIPSCLIGKIPSQPEPQEEHWAKQVPDISWGEFSTPA
jgi:hypothetical protein